LAVKLDIQKPEDWQRVGVNTILKEGGNFLVTYYKSSVSRGKLQRHIMGDYIGDQLVSNII
jgi:hypothetical protein